MRGKFLAASGTEEWFFRALDARSSRNRIKTMKEESTIRRSADLQAAADYLNRALAKRDEAMLMSAMRDVVEETGGGMGELARNAELHRSIVYRVLSGDGDLELKTLNKMLRAMGLRLLVAPGDASAHQRGASAASAKSRRVNNRTRSR